MDAEVLVNYVAQLSGHRNLKSLDSYKAASADHQRKMSLILSPSGQEKYSDIDSKRPRKRHFTSETSQRCQ